jgi:putative transposase
MDLNRWNGLLLSAPIRKALKTQPGDATHWSCRTVAANQMGVSNSAVQRVREALGSRFDRRRSFKPSSDRLFVGKLRDIVGLYLDVPQNAMVLCLDEKGQRQASERTQPVLPMRLGHVKGVTYDYVRHGKSTLLAALDIANGRIVTHQSAPCASGVLEPPAPHGQESARERWIEW